MTRVLVLGGARSGKSAFAEHRARSAGKQVIYIATARAGDAEMRARIAHHRHGRPSQWTTVEEPVALGAALRQWCAPERVVLVDCLTLWLSNLMFDGDAQYPEVGDLHLPPRFEDERAAFLDALAHARGEVVLVSNELGMGIVPHGAISRRFADEAGRLNQLVAQCCEQAVLLVAGLPLTLKGQPCLPA